MIRTLIIEDESDAAFRLESMLKIIMPDILIVGILDSIEAAVNWFQTSPAPDLLMLDIQLGDGQSFEIFKKVKIDCFVIFTTAYDEYAIKAFELNSIDYLLKPINQEKLNRSIEKFQKLKTPPPHFDFEKLVEQLETKQNKLKKRFIVSIGERLKSIAVQEIAFFYSMEKNSFLCTFNNQHYPLEFSLDHLEGLLDPNQFFRINRKYLIHYNTIIKIIILSKSRIKLTTDPEIKEELIVSNARTHDFRKWLDQ